MVLDDYEMSFVINTGIWLVSLDCLNTLIVMKFATKIVSTRRTMSGTSAIIEQVEEMLRTT